MLATAEPLVNVAESAGCGRQGLKYGAPTPARSELRRAGRNQAISARPTRQSPRATNFGDVEVQLGKGFVFDAFGYYDIVLSMKPCLRTLRTGTNRDMVVLAAMAAAIHVTGNAGAAGSSPMLEQRVQSFSIQLDGSVAEVTPLFGPVRESEWAPAWSPCFLHPPVPNQTEGAIFTTSAHDGHERLWFLTTYNPATGRVAYLTINPRVVSDQITIEVAAAEANRSNAIVTYRRSALSSSGNAEVVRLNAQWAADQRLEWESAINAALRQEKHRHD